MALAFDDLRVTSGLPTMFTPWILLAGTSLDFLRHLYSLIRHDEEEQFYPAFKLQASGLRPRNIGKISGLKLKIYL